MTNEEKILFAMQSMLDQLNLESGDTGISPMYAWAEKAGFEVGEFKHMMDEMKTHAVKLETAFFAGYTYSKIQDRKL